MRAGYVFSEVATGLRRNITMTLAMILTTAVSLGLLGFGLIIARMSDQTRVLYADKLEISIYLTPDQSAKDANCQDLVCQALETSLKSDPNVASVEYETQAQALARYNQEFAGLPEMLAIVRENSLSASFEVKPLDPQRFKVISDTYQTKAGVQSIDDESQIFNRLFSLLNSLRDVALVIALIQAFAAVLLISNMVQVAALSRRTETSIMRLVGASRWRTQLPFMIEAVVAGVVGVGLSIVGLVVAKLLLFDKVFGSIISAGILPTIDSSYLVWAGYWLAAIGVGLSGISAYVTLRAYVRL